MNLVKNILFVVNTNHWVALTIPVLSLFKGQVRVNYNNNYDNFEVVVTQLHRSWVRFLLGKISYFHFLVTTLLSFATATIQKAISNKIWPMCETNLLFCFILLHDTILINYIFPYKKYMNKKITSYSYPICSYFNF